MFEISNVGHWYAAPPAINTMIYFNFDPEFQLIELKYGSIQELSSNDVKIGKRRMKYIRASQIKLPHYQDAEQVHVRVIAPTTAGRYTILVSAFSEDRVFLSNRFRVWCQ
jgi:hypothetical protein